MRQLKMLRPAAPVTPRPLPEGYTYAPYRATEEELTEWLDMCFKGQLLPENPPESGNYRDWFKVTVLDYADLNPAEDVIFVVDGEGRTGQKFSLCILTPEKEHFIRAETKEIISG